MIIVNYFTIICISLYHGSTKWHHLDWFLLTMIVYQLTCTIHVCVFFVFRGDWDPEESVQLKSVNSNQKVHVTMCVCSHLYAVNWVFFPTIICSSICMCSSFSFPLFSFSFKIIEFLLMVSVPTHISRSDGGDCACTFLSFCSVSVFSVSVFFFLLTAFYVSEGPGHSVSDDDFCAHWGWHFGWCCGCCQHVWTCVFTWRTTAHQIYRVLWPHSCEHAHYLYTCTCAIFLYMNDAET